MTTRFRQSYSSMSMSCKWTRLKKSSSEWFNSGKAVIWVKRCIFVFCQVVQKHYLGEVEKQSSFRSYFLSNISAKNYQNWLMFHKVLWSQRRDVFKDTVYNIVYVRQEEVCILAAVELASADMSWVVASDEDVFDTPTRNTYRFTPSRHHEQKATLRGPWNTTYTRVWADAQHDGCDAEYRWRPLFTPTPTTTVPCSNVAKMQNPLKFVGLPQTPELISAVSVPKFTILRGHVEDILLLNKFFPIVDICLSCEDTAQQSCWDGDYLRHFCILYFQRAACSTFQTCILNLH